MNVLVLDPFSVRKDVSMPFLAQAIDPGIVLDYLKRISFFYKMKDCLFNLLAIRVVRHKLGRRCLLEYDIEIEKAKSKQKVITIIGKARAKGIDRKTYDISCKLWETGFHFKSNDSISVPQPIGFVPELNMWFQKKVPGIVATKLLSTNNCIKLIKRISEAAFKIQKTNISTSKQHTITDELFILQTKLNQVIKEQPKLENRVKRVLEACHNLGYSIPSSESTGIHRDFYPDQILVDGNHLHIVDFDLYCKGDPGLDIGNFIGHMIEHAIRFYGNPNCLSKQATAMEESFLTLYGKREMFSIKAYTILTLARHIFISTQFVERKPFTEMLIRVCEEKLEELGLI